MNLNYKNTKIGKDEQGIFAMIQFGTKKFEKIYIDELFEEYAQEGTAIDLSIETNTRIDSRNAPPAFYEDLNENERERIKSELDLRKFYSKIPDDLNLHTYLKNLHEKNPPKLKFVAKSINDHKKWANILVEKLKDLIHYDMGKVPLEIEKGPVTTYKNIELSKIYIKTAEFLKVPAILAKPIELNKKVPAIVCVHGHNYGKINTIGMEKSLSNSYYGIELALRGYVTLSLDQWGWGERRMQYKGRVESYFEKAITRSALLLGLTSIGIRTWEVSRAIDYLETLDDINGKFGIVGQSGGGTTSSFASVIDKRIDAAVISGYYCTWFDSIFSMNHCICNFIPGVWNYFDQPDMVAARAPKPTYIVAGEFDPIFPIKGVKKAYSSLKKAYKLYGKEENLGIDIIPNTGHVFRGDYAYPWFDKHLL